jgi:hypothetical protein
MKTTLASAALLAYGLLCLRAGLGPLALAVCVLQHCQAVGRWTVREAVPALWRSRERYREALEEVRRG